METIRTIKELYQNEKIKLDELTSLTESYEGYSESVRTVMKKRDDIDGIIGVVADILSTEPKYEIAIEVALGNNIQNVVTENEETVEKAICYLKESKAGRATFLSCTNIGNPPALKAKEVLKESGVLGTANELAIFEPQYEDIVKLLLGEIVAVDNLENAIKIARKYKYTLKMVTLDGEFISPGGAISGGAFKSDNIFITRRRRVEELEKQVKKYKACIDQLESD